MTTITHAPRGVAAIALAAVLGLTAMVGCSSPAEDAAAGSDSAPEGGSVADAAVQGASGEKAASGPASQRESQPDIRQVEYEIKSGVVTLESGDVAGVLRKIYGLTVRVDGEIASEYTSTSRDGTPVYSEILLEVPVDQFTTSLEEVSGFGTLLDKTRSTKNVTAQVADIDSRVQNAEDSITQLRLLFDRATELGDIILLESELSQRQGDLEALQAQQRVLAEQTAMSQISITVTRPDPKPEEPSDDETAGFLAGLEQGWDATVTFLWGLSHVIGLLLPIGTLLALVSLLGWLALRRLSWRPRTRTSE